MFKRYDKLAFSPFLQKFQERQLVNLAFAFTAFLQHFQATAAYKGKLIGGSSIWKFLTKLGLFHTIEMTWQYLYGWAPEIKQFITEKFLIFCAKTYLHIKYAFYRLLQAK